MIAMDQPHTPSVLVLINRRSGTVRSRGPQVVSDMVVSALQPVFANLDVELVDGDVAARAKLAVAAETHEIIVAGGGDGTIASVAALLVDTSITMGALPLGTMNLVVQALGFSPRLEDALSQFAGAKGEKMDVGLVNNKVFLHQVSFGLQPRMAKLREKLGYKSRASKMLGAVRALVILTLRSKMVRVNISADGEIMRVKSPMVAITNNPIGSDKHWSVQHRLDSGKLGYYALNQYSLRALFRLARGYLRNRLHDDEIIESRTATTLKIRRRPRRTTGRPGFFKQRKGILASIDGEVVLLENPVTITIKPRCLNVLAVRPQAIAN
jgi:diacylglycerol kinase family enzyme